VEAITKLTVETLDLGNLCRGEGYQTPPNNSFLLAEGSEIHYFGRDTEEITVRYR
jgi:hypothetical protein